MSLTTIAVSRETKEKLAKRGMKGTSYEDIILGLLGEKLN